MTMRILRLMGIAGVLCVAGRSSSAQQLTDIHPGVRVRAIGDRVTNAGVHSFSMQGTVVAVDSQQIILHPQTKLAEDTVSLLGVRRLDLYQGQRSRRSMVLTGASLGAVIGLTAWFIAHQTVRPERQGILVDTPTGVQAREVSGPEPPIIHQIRNTIPLLIGAGGLIGAAIGPERWVRIPVPQSTFPQAR